MTSLPWRVETWKNLRKIEKIFFSKLPKSFPKVFKQVFNMLRACFFGKKMTNLPWRVETWNNSKKSRKHFEISKVSKNVTKSVQTRFEVILSKFFGQCTLEGREVEKFQRNVKTSQNSRYPNTFPKVSKQVLNLFWGFSRKKRAQCTLEGRNLEKLKKNWKTFFFKITKIFPKSVQKSFQYAPR